MESDASSSPKNYYVESPSRDSNSQDESDDKVSSDRSSSPSDSPSVPRSSPASTNFTRLSDHRRARWNKHYCEIVAEEAQDDAYSIRSARFLYIVLTLVLTVLAAFVVLWAAAMPFKPRVSLKSLVMNRIDMGRGSDRSGVPTWLIWVNCSANLTVSNTATFYGIHVSSPYANLLFSQVTIANGQMHRYYQPRKSERRSWVTFVGKGVPLYGAVTEPLDRNRGIPMELQLEIESCGNILGSLLRAKHRRRVACTFFVDPRLGRHVKFLGSSCHYA